MILALLYACAAPEPPPADLVALDAPRLARRTSLDLRGVLPSAEELDAVAADPAALDGLIDTWLADPRFEDRVVQLLQERWWTRVDVFDITWYDYGLAPEQEYPFERAVGEEPLRIIARVIADDLPWTEVVEGDWTMTDDILATHWPVDYPAGATGWQVTHYTDGRPAAGVLATNGLWWRYTTTTSNMNRARAAAISRLLLCDDILARGVSFGNSVTAGDPAEAVHEDPYCLACHSSVDPLAASLFGFWWLNQYSVVEETTYHPERERLADELGVAPAWFGEPMDGLSDLGYHVASDSRFYSCAVQSFAEGLWRRDATLDDTAQLESLRVGFLRGGALVKPLLRAILATPTYTAGSVRDGAAADVVARERTTRLLTPDQLAGSLADLTGFRWTYGGFDQLDSDTTGFRLLAGGVDGQSTYAPQTEPGLTWDLVVKRLSEAAAATAVGGGLGVAGTLLADVDPDAVPGDPAFDDALAALHWRLYAEKADAAWIADMGALWTPEAAAEGPEAAWALVLTVMFRDPEFVSE